MKNTRKELVNAFFEAYPKTQQFGNILSQFLDLADKEKANYNFKQIFG